jgi:hypothetical protein
MIGLRYSLPLSEKKENSKLVPSFVIGTTTSHLSFLTPIVKKLF